jgi:hypothetical protein
MRQRGAMVRDIAKQLGVGVGTSRGPCRLPPKGRRLAAAKNRSRDEAIPLRVSRFGTLGI